MGLFPELEDVPLINPISLESFCTVEDLTEKNNALISRFLGIPFPEQLDDVTWAMKVRQIEYLLEAGFLPVKPKM